MAWKKTGLSRLCRAMAFLLCFVFCMLPAFSSAGSADSGTLALSLPRK